MRLAQNPDPSKLFVSGIHGDPGTPLLRAYLGDPILVRALVGSAKRSAYLACDGPLVPDGTVFDDRYAAEHDSPGDRRAV